jgi:hypothetical protein
MPSKCQRSLEKKMLMARTLNLKDELKNKIQSRRIPEIFYVELRLLSGVLKATEDREMAVFRLGILG